MFLQSFVALILCLSVAKAGRVSITDEVGGLNLGLDNLGESIRQNVEISLQPVRALELNNRMKSGIGGVTVLTLQPSGKEFLVQGSSLFECPKPISEKGKCDGEPRQFQIKNKEDFCYSNSYSQTNDHLCFSNGPISFTAYNNHYSCKSLDPNTQSLLITVDDYRKMCAGVAKEAVYKYIADKSNPDHVQIPSPNPYVKCDNKEEGVCVFTDKRDYKGGNVQISSNGSNLQINQGTNANIQISN